ncbi:hypothetical protein [Herbaspirillum sp. RV1423]|uniref:hypothetical protein n=1 Tax=Herbaspirillum sp. RV1423 TaxID=1443993 RepID=UPI0012DFC2C7|nr:hypothetical protein [Herbaspirillum sp. RV1423]
MIALLFLLELPAWIAGEANGNANEDVILSALLDAINKHNLMTMMQKCIAPHHPFAI